MTTFTVLYQFHCPICYHVNVGKLAYKAQSAENASYNLRNHPPACKFCSPLSPTMATANTLIFLPTPEDQNEPETVQV